jgi:putative transposase
MARPFFRLLAVLAGARRSDLRRQVQYLKAENEILRSRLGPRVYATVEERARLVRLARMVGPAIGSLVSIVSPRTILSWINEADGRVVARRPSGTRRPGRPRTAEEIRKLILRIASETGWGYTRILGETRKLGVIVSRTTVVNTLRSAGIPPVSGRGEPTWDEFLRAHARSLWACDFMTRRIVTPRGVRCAFVLVFIHVASRKAIASPSTVRPNAAWVQRQASCFAAAARARGGACRVLVRDSDTKLGATFDSALRAAKVTPLRLPHRAPNLNAHVERLIQTIQTECLDRFIALGTSHLDHLVEQFMEHYHLERPHSGIGHRTPTGPPCTIDVTPVGRVVCSCQLGGTLRHYYRRAA